MPQNDIKAQISNLSISSPHSKKYKTHKKLDHGNAKLAQAKKLI